MTATCAKRHRADQAGRPAGLAQRPRWFAPSLADLFFLCPFLLLAFYSGNALLNDGDTGYHIKAGDYIITQLTVPRHDIFSFIEPPLPWTAHEWLSEVVMAAIHQVFGLTGVAIFFAALIGLTYRLLFRVLQSTGCNVAVVSAIVLLATVSSTIHWLARPHVFSLLITAGWYGLLDQYQRAGKDRLGWLPPLMLIWANLHGGFITGLLLLGVYLASNLASGLFSPRGVRNAAWRRSRRLALIGTACVAAALCNPNGYALLLFPLDVVSNRFVLDNVSEFLSPNFHRALPYKYLLILTIGVVSLSRKSLDFVETALLLLFTYMSLYSARYIPLFAIISAPILARQIQAWLRGDSSVARWLETRGRNLALLDTGTARYLWPVTAVALVSVFGWSGKIAATFDNTLKPVAAVEFLKREHLPGRMFNDDEFGDYLIYAAWPQYRVFFDGRSDMYGETWGGAYTKVTRLHPDWEAVVEKHGFSWMFLPTSAPLSVVLSRHEAWHLIYADTVARIFLKKIPENADVIAKYPDVKAPQPKGTETRSGGFDKLPE